MMHELLDEEVTADQGVALLESAAVAPPRHDVSILGVRISDYSKVEAMRLFETLIEQADGAAHGIYIVNAHSLNLATDMPSYRAVLNRAHRVFGDGTGVRWAARQRGVRLRDNLVGTDLVPEFFAATAGRGFRYYLLGAGADTIERAAAEARRRFPGWTLAGFHHGYVNDGPHPEVIDEINASEADMLLVGMGNPLQEIWIDRHLADLRTPICVGVGGLFDHWAGNLRRAPRWVRWLGYEWAQLLLQQPSKWRRYLVGNPKFLWRMTRDFWLGRDAAGHLS